jgi:hypothetical protein
MPRYKRTRDDAELDLPVEAQVAPENLETLTKLRNMWEFASLMQYIFLFGHVVKIDDDFDIEVWNTPWVLIGISNGPRDTLKYDADEIAITGSRSGVPEAYTIRAPRAHRSPIFEIRFFAPRPYVCSPPS